MPIVNSKGFTLIELVIVMAVAAILASVTLPNLRGRELRMARLDAVQALTRVQYEQEQFRNNHGRYTDELSALRGVRPDSPQGRYALSVHSTGAESFHAEAVATGHQQRDRECPSITLDVNQGFARQGPTPACWGR